MDEEIAGTEVAVVESDDDLLTPEEVAKILRVGRTTVYRLLRDDKMPHVKMPHSPARIKRRQVTEFIDAHTIHAAAS